MQELTKEKPAGETIFIEADEEEDSLANKYLLFNLGKEVYGIAIVNVTEIIEMQKITEMPDMPGYVKGVINLRGRVIPAMDLRLRFGMEQRACDDRTCMIIVSMGGISLGLIVDTVAEVRDIREQDIDPPPQFKTHEERNRYISGLGKVGEEVKILIDADKILHEKDWETIKEKTRNREENHV